MRIFFEMQKAAETLKVPAAFALFVNDSIADGQLQRSVEKTETVAVLRYLIVATAFAVVAVEKHYGKGYHKSGSQRQIVVVIQHCVQQ